MQKDLDRDALIQEARAIIQEYMRTLGHTVPEVLCNRSVEFVRKTKEQP